MEDIASRRGIGEVLAEGVYRAALEIARRKGLELVQVLRCAVQVKGIGGSGPTESGAERTIRSR